MGVRLARPEEHDRVAEVLRRGFREDPFVRWVTRGKPRALHRYVDLVLRRLVMPHGEVHVDDDLESTALWVRPGGWEVSMLGQLMLLPSVAGVVGWRRLGVMGRASELIERDRPQCWYLALVATLPEARGRGLGRAVLRPGLELAERDRVPAVLETSNEANVAWYETLGFRVVRRLELSVLEPNAPDVWTLRRVRPVD